MKLINTLIALATVAFLPLQSSAREFTPDDVPEPLKPWVNWVTYDVDRNNCPFLSQHDANAARPCVWFGAMAVSISDAGGSFSFPLTVYQKDSFVTLPGNEQAWPVSVRVNNAAASVIEQNNQPVLKLQPGTYQVNGSFVWKKLPDMLQLPAGVGVVNASINGEALAAELDDGNAWWLNRKQDTVQNQADSLDITPFRHIADGIPLTVDTSLLLQISGKQRETVITPVLLPGFVPMEVSGGLPARLEPDGSLRVQLRPGTWNVTVRARHQEPVASLTLPKENALAKQEIWVFDAQPNLRMVQVDGVRSIDPSQTQLPGEWQSLPAYLVTPGDTLTLVEKKRGTQDAGSDQLNLTRDWWLNFDGDGYTVHDQFYGTIRQSSRINVQPGMELGRVSINGQDQFITTLGDKKTVGVEIRPGGLNLSADSRIKESVSTLSATGWATDVNSLSGTLHLPPGWRIFAASGVDTIGGGWVNEWTLLDVFLVLITIVASFRLLGRNAAIVVAAGLLLLHPELRALTGLVLFLLAAMALLRVLPPGKFQVGVRFLQRMALLALLLTSLPFIILHVREAIYPQLTENIMPQFYGAGGGRDAMEMQAVDAPMMATAPAPMVMSKAARMKQSFKDNAADISRGQGDAVQSFYQYDPNSKVQTGFGVANWQGRDVRLSWNGPVDASQKIKLWLLSPFMNLVLALLRVLLLVAIVGALFGVPPQVSGWKSLPRRWASLGAMIMLALLLPVSAQAESPYPPDEMLKQLRDRIVTEWNKSPECLPNCATVSRSNIQASGNQLLILQEINVQQAVAVPLPGPVKEWRPSVVLVDGKPITALRMEDGSYLYAVLPAGVHSVQMVGALPARDTVSIGFPLTSRVTESSGNGWDIQGIEDRRGTDNLRLIRSGMVKSTENETLKPGVLPPFLAVERTVTLGVQWQVETVVRRLTPLGSAIALNIPLLKNESVLTPDITVKDGSANITLAPQVSEIRWSSQLKPMSQLLLTAPKNTPWTEQWRISASNLWHTQFSGLPSTGNAEDLMPLFQPWPGETLTIDIVRPGGVEGRTLTVDNSNLNVTVGTRSLESSLSITLRSSQGGQHDIQLPPDAKLTRATVNGNALPLQLKKGIVTLPITPGVQSAQLVWQQTQEIGTRFRAPAVDLKVPSVNADTTLILPSDRWVLLAGGPSMGPAVLFWGILPVLVIAAFVLGGLGLAPLKTWHWFLLLLGLSQSSLPINLVVVGWLLVLGWRAKQDSVAGKEWLFNLRQVAIGLWTLVALSSLFSGIKRGLLGSPDMKIEGSGSNSHMLHWYQDIVSSVLPQPWVISLPVLAYRGLMLAWALWLAFALVRWLQWGWKSYTSGGYWKEKPRAEKEKKPS